MNNDDFYIGYHAKAPEGVHSFTRKTVAGILISVVVVAVLLVVSQQAFYPATFEYLQYQTFKGTFHTHPYPMLQVLHPGDNGTLPSYAHYYLVNEGKLGTQNEAATFDGRRVEVEGALIHRDDQVMIEIKAGTLKTIADVEPTPVSDAQHLGTFTLAGEIVDSKCFLGVMNPGSQKPHRACATRCISGGIPPLFVVRDNGGATSYLVLQAKDGRAVNRDILDVIAEPLEITGEVLLLNDILVLKADPTTYRRLNH